MPNQSDPNQPAANPPAVAPPMDLPPLPTDTPFSNQNPASAPPAPTASQGSAAPPETPSVISSTPKKKFGGGRIIATILGVLVLVGGLGAGLVLTGQIQNPFSNASVLECFPAGTKISLSNGEEKNIESLNSGDVVVSENEQGSVSPSSVTKLLKLWSFNMSTIVFESGDSLKLTNPHPLYTKDGWKAIDVKAAKFHSPGLPIGQLVKGDFVKKEDGSWDKILSISTSYGLFRVYNLTVDNNHDYFANGFMAHNKGGNEPQFSGGKCVKNCDNEGGGGGGGGQPAPTPYVNPIVQQDCIYGAVADTQGGHCASGPNGGVTTGAGGANHDVAAGGTCNTTLDCSGTLGCWNGKCSTPPANGGPGASCVTDVNCTNGYICSSGTCQANPITTTCGRNLDPGAPICCTSGCSTGNLTCEQGRQECNTGGTFCTIQAKSSSCTGANKTTTTENSPSPNPTAPQCLNVLAFSSTWTLLAGTDLSALTPGTSVNFCVGGSQGTFDQAQFQVNSTTEPVTTTKGQGAAANDFCQVYTILSTDSTVNVKAKIHDSTSNTWVGESF